MQKLMLDLRRVQNIRFRNRDNIELLQHRIGFLSGQDKTLMSLYYVDGCSCSRIASLVGINECNVARRIRRITSRLLAGQYIRCLRNKKYFSLAELLIARDYYVRRKTIRQIAQQSGCSFYEIRKTIQRIEAVLEAAEGRRTYKES